MDKKLKLFILYEAKHDIEFLQDNREGWYYCTGPCYTCNVQTKCTNTTYPKIPKITNEQKLLWEKENPEKLIRGDNDK